MKSLLNVVNRYRVAVLMLFGLVFSSVSSMAVDVYPSADASVTASGTLFAAIGVIAAAILLWKIGSRLASRYIK